MISERKKILFLVPAFAGGMGGPERVIATLLRHVDHSRFECHLALVGEGSAFLEGIPREVTVHPLGVSRMRYCLPSIIQLARRIRPQTILSTVIYLNAMLMLGKPFLAGRPKILLREAVLPSAFLAHESRHPRITKWLYRTLYPRADRIICLFDAMIDDMTRHLGIPRDKLIRIYNPVDVEMVRHLAANAATPYSGRGPHLVTVGRLQYQKAHDVLLQAFPKVLKSFPEAQLAVLGEGPLENELKKQAASLGLDHAVSFLGFQQNPWAYVKHADLFVLASRFEGLPNALLEVLGLGVPVVVTDCPGGVREIHKAAPQILLVQPEDADALADGIIASLSNRGSHRSSLEQATDYLGDFDLQKVVVEYSRLF
jgi:glycosyltransferase involved in cell wall biosynthesis